MRIVVAGNFNERKAGANFYATVRKLANGFTRNGHMVLPFSDRDVSREQGRFGIGRAGDAEANRRLILLCRQFRPALVLLVHADKISNETLREIKALPDAPRIAVVNLDPLFLPENPPRIRRFGEVADMTFITTAGEKLGQFASATHRLAFMPNPTDASIETFTCFERNDQSVDLFGGNGLLTFVARSSGYGEIFGEDELAFYDGPDDLAARLRHFRKNDAERQAVAAKGHAKYHAIFNDRLVAQFLVEATFGFLDDEDYAWPTTIYGG